VMCPWCALVIAGWFAIWAISAPVLFKKGDDGLVWLLYFVLHVAKL